ncbi:hypothetical protein RRG08_004676 [Elysia crispata]|uniref:Uncharacterized protein n=1 Tax=Elysia crispata TaxID=231223 RepID=A0AAE1AAU8_9GAST|nr:hypothetical protein RRG08_004676 [Elysia crispata]
MVRGRCSNLGKAPETWALRFTTTCYFVCSRLSQIRAALPRSIKLKFAKLLSYALKIGQAPHHLTLYASIDWETSLMGFSDKGFC